jgi:hypothetical protein
LLDILAYHDFKQSTPVGEEAVEMGKDEKGLGEDITGEE